MLRRKLQMSLLRESFHQAAAAGQDDSFFCQSLGA
jgi:hypothetical protein